MNHIYVLQDENYYAIGATFEAEKAIEICKGKNMTYREVPFYKCADTEIILKAGPIPKEYWPKSK